MDREGERDREIGRERERESERAGGRARRVRGGCVLLNGVGQTSVTSAKFMPTTSGRARCRNESTKEKVANLVALS